MPSTLRLAGGGLLTASGSPRPAITKQASAANYSFTVSSGATLTVNGLNIACPDANGLSIANGATVTQLDNCYFSGGNGATNTYLSLLMTSGTYIFNFCDFDVNCQHNVSAVNAGTENITMVNSTGAHTGAGFETDLFRGERIQSRRHLLR